MGDRVSEDAAGRRAWGVEETGLGRVGRSRDGEGDGNEVWWGEVRCGLVWCGEVRFGKVWLGWAGYGTVWCGKVWCGMVKFSLRGFCD